MALDSNPLWKGIADRLRRTNWAALIASVAIQGGFFAVLISMGVVSGFRKEPQRTTLTVLSSRQQPPPPPPAATKPRAEAPPLHQTPPRIQLSSTVPAPVLQAPAPPAPPVAPAAPAPSAPEAPVAPAAPSAGSGPVSVSNLNTNLLSGSPPSYPMGSRRKREQGTVVLRLVVSEDGRVTQISVQRSSGFAALDDAALAAVRRWRWSPTVRDGRPVAITGLVQIPFVLRDS